MSDLESWSPDDVRKFDRFIEDGVRTLQQIDDLRSGLRETTKALATEYNYDVKKLTELLRVSFKDILADKKETMHLLEEILHVTGRG